MKNVQCKRRPAIRDARLVEVRHTWGWGVGQKLGYRFLEQERVQGTQRAQHSGEETTLTGRSEGTGEGDSLAHKGSLSPGRQEEWRERTQGDRHLPERQGTELRRASQQQWQAPAARRQLTVTW